MSNERRTKNYADIVGYLKEIPKIYQTEYGHIGTAILETEKAGKSDDKDKIFLERHRVVVKGEHAELVRDKGKAGMLIRASGPINTRKAEVKDAETGAINHRCF